MQCRVFRTVSRSALSNRRIQEVVIGVTRTLRVQQGSIGVHIVGDTKMRRLNREHRGKDKTTDVLSFPTDAYDATTGFACAASDHGDIFISNAHIVRQARDHGVSAREEFTRMLVHGVLHLFGYDHVTKKQAAEMFGLQESFVQRYR